MPRKESKGMGKVRNPFKGRKEEVGNVNRERLVQGEIKGLQRLRHSNTIHKALELNGTCVNLEKEIKNEQKSEREFDRTFWRTSFLRHCVEAMARERVGRASPAKTVPERSKV